MKWTWQDEETAQDHFRRHRRLLGVDTVDAYRASAEDTIARGTYFEYRDPESDDWRVGYYDRDTRRFTALLADESAIVTHFRCPERYAYNLPESSYT